MMIFELLNHRSGWASGIDCVFLLARIGFKTVEHDFANDSGIHFLSFLFSIVFSLFKKNIYGLPFFDLESGRPDSRKSQGSPFLAP